MVLGLALERAGALLTGITLVQVVLGVTRGVCGEIAYFHEMCESGFADMSCDRW